MAVVSEDRVSYIIVVRGLDIIEENDVLEFYGVADYALAAYECRTSDERAVSDFCLRSDDARSSDMRLGTP